MAMLTPHPFITFLVDAAASSADLDHKLDKAPSSLSSTLTQKFGGFQACRLHGKLEPSNPPQADFSNSTPQTPRPMVPIARRNNHESQESPGPSKPRPLLRRSHTSTCRQDAFLHASTYHRQPPKNVNTLTPWPMNVEHPCLRSRRLGTRPMALDG
jgi:hypothetical protein